jgi:hypothetical protein
VLLPVQRAILIAVCGDWLASFEEQSMADLRGRGGTAPVHLLAHRVDRQLIEKAAIEGQPDHPAK